MRLDDIVRYCDDYLNVRQVADAPDALNGLQVNNTGVVTRLAAAVDACQATVRSAAEQGADLLLVHHGLFWGGSRPLVGPRYHRLADLLRHNVAVYSSHLPLDRHPEVGNAPLLAHQLGVAVRGEFGIWQEQACGVWGELEVTREQLAERLMHAIGAAPKLMPFGPAAVRRVGIVTGSGGSLIPQAAEAGLDTYITGEGSHHTYFDAEELRLNVYYGGHYATETFGVKALAEHLAAKFGLPWVFIDHPTGL